MNKIMFYIQSYVVTASLVTYKLNTYKISQAIKVIRDHEQHFWISQKRWCSTR